MFGQVSYADPSIASALLILILLLGLVFSLLMRVWIPAGKTPDPRPEFVRPKERLLADPAICTDFGGKRHLVRKVDRRVFAWLTALCESDLRGPSVESHRPLLAFRHDFRAITRLHAIGGLVSCLRSSNRDLRRLAIYLLGRSTRGATVNALKALRDDPDPRIRREVAKALARMSEWTEFKTRTWIRLVLEHIRQLVRTTGRKRVA